MRILNLEEMMAVSGGGGLDSPGMSDAGYGGSHGKGGGSKGSHGSSGNNGRPSNSGWGATIGGLLGGTVGRTAVGGYGTAAAIGHTIGRYAGKAFGNAAENGYVAGANAAIDKTLHDTNNAAARAAASSSRWGSR